MDPMFSIPTLSILDRGVVYVIAHIRGGGEMGRTWYLNGKKLHKKNSFTDFVDVTDYLATKPWRILRVSPATAVLQAGCSWVPC